jgi:hypothetical protein
MQVGNVVGERASALGDRKVAVREKRGDVSDLGEVDARL